MSAESDKFWEREAKMTRHRLERQAYREAQIEALFTQPCERKDCQTHHEDPCPGCGRRWTNPTTTNGGENE